MPVLKHKVDPSEATRTLCGRSLAGTPTGEFTSDDGEVGCPFCLDRMRHAKNARHAEIYGAAFPSPKKGITAAERQMMVHWITGMEFERLLDGKEVRAVPRTLFSDNRLGSYVEVVGEGTFFTGLYRLSTGKWVVCHERVS